MLPEEGKLHNWGERQYSKENLLQNITELTRKPVAAMTVFRSIPALFVLVIFLSLGAEVEAFIGYGIEMYNPSCAFACRSAIAGFMLDCSTSDAGHGGAHSHGSGPTTPECRAADTSYLQTLAWCINKQCAPFDVKVSKLEWYWEQKATGSLSAIPKWTYGEALLNITVPPTEFVGESEMLNFTAKVDEERWALEKGSMEFFEWQEGLHSRYGIVLLVVGFGLPIILSWVGYIPYTTTLIEKAKGLITYPSTIGAYVTRPLEFSVGYAPTIGQSIYISILFALALILTCVSYKSFPSNTWFEGRYYEILAYVANRTGVLAFALLPLVILFSSRNNFLLWLTNWSHTTYLLLHRWTAWMLVIQTVVHSIAELIGYWKTHATESAELYWIWGIIGTLSMVIMIPLSLLWVRKSSYELFLISHIVLAVFSLVGCWYHVEYLFTRKWGYERWLYAAFGVWIFDRSLRVLRIWKLGMQRAVVRDITDTIVRIDIPGVRWGFEAGKHAYVSFPTLSLIRPWENHPFSIIPTALLLHSKGVVSHTQTAVKSSEDIEKSAAHTTEVNRVDSSSLSSLNGDPINTAGVTLFIRKAKGLTKHLSARTNLPTLLEGPYSSSHSASLSKTDRLIVIAGGIGITGAFPYMKNHMNSKLFWSVKDGNEGLVREFDGALGGGAEKEIRVGRRFDVKELVEKEASEKGNGRLGVVVCGPAGMCDEVREAVVLACRKGVVVELHVEAFCW